MKRSSGIKRGIKLTYSFLHSVISSIFHKANVRLYQTAPRDKEKRTNILFLGDVIILQLKVMFHCLSLCRAQLRFET